MATTLKDKLNKLPKSRRKKIRNMADEIIAEEMSLHELRVLRELTQVDMAELLDIRQENVSRIEKRSDIKLSTLRNYVESAGGHLKLIVEFSDMPTVSLLVNNEEESSHAEKKASKLG